MKKNLTIAIVITFLILLAAHALPSFFNGIESKWIDAYFNVRGEKPPTNDIVLVTIDERSISKLGRWPWPRHIMADLVEKLASYGVTTIAFDVTFSEHSSEDFQLAKAFKKFPDAYLGYFLYLSPEEIGNAQSSDFDLTIIQAKKGVDKAFLDNLKSVLGETYLLGSGEKLEDSETVDVVIIIGSGKKQL